MFDIQHSAHKLLVEHNHNPLLEGLEVNIKLDDGKNLPLPFQEMKKEQKNDSVGEFTAYICTFTDEKENTAAVIFHRYADFTAVYVDTKLEKGELFRSSTSMAAKEAVTVTIRNIPSNYQLMANYQHKDWWTRPFFGEDIKEIPGKTQSLLLKTEESYYHMLPVVDGDFRTEIKGTEEGLQFSTSAYQAGYREISGLAFLLGANDNPFTLVDTNVKKATSLANSNVKPRDEKNYPEMLDYLGWCSWDAFYKDVNDKGLLEKAKELNELDVPVKWMMIDDGWSDLKDNQLFSFGADKAKFPNGLSEPVKEIKEKYGFNWVGVWHTIAGYWAGIHPESDIAKELLGNLFRTNRGSIVPYPDAKKGFGFWHEWHKQLSEAGIDFVKVDSQSAIAKFFTHEMPIGKAAAGAHEALEASTSMHFDNTVINCMGMAAENVWNRPYSSLSRNSDDFVPSEENGFREHALQNAYNSYYHGSFYFGDWDMYWSMNHDDKQNMILRAVSGGPIYVSDEVGKTNPDHILPLVYKDGKIIRCEQPGLPTEDCLMTNPAEENIPLKIWNRINGTGVIAAFHISGKETLENTVSPKDVPGLEGVKFLLLDVINKESQMLAADEKVSIQLEKDDAKLFVVIPLNETITPIGLMNKFIPADSLLESRELENRVTYRLREGGRFAFVTDSEVKNVFVNSQSQQAERVDGQENMYIVECENDGEPVTVEITF